MTPPVASGILPAAQTITVTINGVKHDVPTTFSEVSLNDYLRHHLQLTGTKVTCREGGCGVCIVQVAYPDAAGQIIQRSINSCLCPILSCDGWEVTTVEGIGNQEKPHPVQQALTDHYGTQCGYCTPGWVMSMYSLLQNNLGRPLTKQQVENAMDGNYCRCTGYRPILDAFKTFAQNGANENAVCDLEDVGSKTCKTTGGPCHGKCADFRARSPYVASLPMEAAIVAPPWYKPTTLDELYKKATELVGKNVYYVVGHTGKGVYNDYPYDAYVDLKGIPALYGVTKTDKTLTIAANTPLTDVIATFNQTAASPGFKYLTALAAIISKTAHTSVRNAGSWAGNLALKNKHQEFPSDTYTAFTAANAKILIGPENKLYTMEDFRAVDLKGKFILEAQFPTYTDDYVFRTYKVMQRATNAHALVEAGFRAKIDRKQAGTVTIAEKPALVFQNITAKFVHAKATEDFLTGKNIADPEVLNGALTALQNEVQPHEDPSETSAAYRRSLAISLFYKFALELVGDLADARYKTAVGSLVRPVSSGSQSFETKQENWPITQAIPKVESMVQCTGEAKYISDIETEGILHAAYVLTTQANASIYRLDSTAALAFPGVVRVITAADIPGKNALVDPLAGPGAKEEELLATKQSDYAGQPVAIVVAISRDIAEEGAKLVKVEYFNVQTPILTCREAIDGNSFHETRLTDINVGDADSSIKSANVTVEGSFEMGSQQHFHTETMVFVCYPTEDGMNVEAGTQHIDSTQATIAQATGLGKNRINVTVKRIGGGFGAKGGRNNMVAAATGIAAWVMKRPVKMHQSLWDNFKSIGRRLPYLIKYQAGADAAGKLAGITFDVYGDSGSFPSGAMVINFIPHFVDNVYSCPAWKIRFHACKTHTAPNTFCRAPASTEAIYAMEYVLEHLAAASNKNVVDLKRLNFMKNGDKLLEGPALKDSRIEQVVNELMTTATYNDRVAAVDHFNKANRWRKRGIAMVPMRFPVEWTACNYNCLVAIYHEGGTIAVTHGGIELGQGINTKVVQVIAYELGVDMSRIQIQPTMAITNPNARGTFGSQSTEIVCLAAIECCRQLNDRLKPVRDASPNAKWEDLIEMCYRQGIDLSARTWTNPKSAEKVVYNTFCATSTEVEVDILTGETQILRLDCLYDCGESISPYIDIGQVEGAIVMGLGYYMTEEIRFHPKTGENLTFGTWKYKPLFAKDIPIDFRVSLLKNAPNPSGILRSKLMQEPPLCSTASVVFALRQAIQASRSDAGMTDWFANDVPMTVERVQQYAQIGLGDLVYGP